jgi:gas vesicle protein
MSHNNESQQSTEARHTESQHSEPQYYHEAPRKNQGHFGVFVTGFLIGSLASATYALLNVPQSGRETREQIMAKGLELRNRADEEVQHIRMHAEEMVSKARTQVDDLQSKVAEQAEDIQTRVSGAVREGKKGARAISEELTTSSETSKSETEAAA